MNYDILFVKQIVSVFIQQFGNRIRRRRWVTRVPAVILLPSLSNIFGFLQRELPSEENGGRLLAQAYLLVYPIQEPLL